MKLSDVLLTERLSSVLYHITSFPSAISILESNELRSPTGEVSFTRSLLGKYPSSYKLIGVIFKFDGDKLNQRYKGGPVGTEEYTGSWDSPLEYRGKDNGQFEDRLYLKSKGDKVPGISNIISYITGAIIYIPDEYLSDGYRDEFGRSYARQIQALSDVTSLLESNNINYWVATSERGVINRGGLTLSELLTKHWDSIGGSDELASRFEVDRREPFKVLAMFDFDEGWYNKMLKSNPDYEDIDYETLIKYYRHKVKLKVYVEDEGDIEEEVRKQLQSKYSNKQLEDLDIVVDD